MSTNLDPKKFGLPPRTDLVKEEDGSIWLVIDRKSRIIMADGRRILEKINKIKALEPKTKIGLMTSAPVCGKTTLFLGEQGVEIRKL
jgi:hypothetical protein